MLRSITAAVAICCTALQWQQAPSLGPDRATALLLNSSAMAAPNGTVTGLRCAKSHAKRWWRRAKAGHVQHGPFCQQLNSIQSFVSLLRHELSVGWVHPMLPRHLQRGHAGQGVLLLFHAIASYAIMHTGGLSLCSGCWAFSSPHGFFNGGVKIRCVLNRSKGAHAQGAQKGAVLLLRVHAGLA